MLIGIYFSDTNYSHIKKFKINEKYNISRNQKSEKRLFFVLENYRNGNCNKKAFSSYNTM